MYRLSNVLNLFWWFKVGILKRIGVLYAQSYIRKYLVNYKKRNQKESRGKKSYPKRPRQMTWYHFHLDQRAWHVCILLYELTQ